MKKIVAVMAMVLMAGSAHAANGHRTGAMALGVDTNFFGSSPLTTGVPDSDMITGKYMLSSNMALTAGLAFATYGNDADGTDLAFKVGARNYFATADFSPFIGGRFGYGSYNDGDLHYVEFAAEFGAEYFMAPQFSVEGVASFGYVSIDDDQDDVTTSRLGTSRAALGVNFYF